MAGPTSVPTPPSNVIRTTSPDMCQFTSVSEASWKTTVLVEPASPAIVADRVKAISLARSTS